MPASLPLLRHEKTVMQKRKGTFVLIHGAGGGGWEYDLWRPVLQNAGWNVVAKDLLPAPGGLEKTVFADYVKQVRAWIPKSGKVVLAGASMGGILALKSAEAGSPAALILINSTVPAGIGPARTAKPASPPVIRWANGPLEETRDAMPDSDEKTIRWAWKRWRDESGAVVNAIRKGVPARKPSCPTLVILGEKDTDIPYTTGLELATWAGADVHLYRGVSHVGPLMSRRAAEVADAMRRWADHRIGV
jgi:pimeloyl-ACP methyl ester carboxylesterase